MQKAIPGMEAEVIVIDNNSTDGSVEYLQPVFPWIKFVANQENLGYAKANNQGWQMAQGQYLLFLNPDTILGEDCLRQSLQVLEQQAGIGAVGVRMIDGSGRFLPESKRGFPSPRASFFKLSGLINVFPRSRVIAQYYLGQLPEKANNEIDVLTGAFMMVKQAVLQKTGGFDERFFMYGEDIDLSYRIKLAGFKNYYLATASMIHFKGESTKKDMAYTKRFYTAMRIFVDKHYEKESRLFSFMVQMAIGVRGVLSFTGRTVLQQQLPQDAYRVIQTIVVGGHAETRKAVLALKVNPVKRNIIIVTGLREIQSVMQVQKTREIIFCAGSIGYKEIFNCMEAMAGEVDFKIFAAESNSIVGSMSKNNTGETVV
ncbi:MAG TPA: glycosyltransferase family 2 protein, partial [Chitinophagaceae bacterium]|nr:glycosyltransferase family 2 protein [Chitinophagaceae bacterium]